MTKTVNKGDRIKVHALAGRTIAGRTGEILETLSLPFYKEQSYRARLDGLYCPVVVLDGEFRVTEESAVGDFKVGDKVGFNYNDHWDDGEAVVTEIKPGADYPIKVRLTKRPSKNELQSVGDTHHWRASNLKHLPAEVKQVDGFKVGDKVGFDNWNDVWAGGEGVVIGLDGSSRADSALNILVKLTKQPPLNTMYPVGNESYWSAKHLNHLPEPVKETPKPEPKFNLDAHKLTLKPQGAVVVDKDDRTWVLVGQQTYVHKGWDGLESLHAASLVKKYGPINERVK